MNRFLLWFLFGLTLSSCQAQKTTLTIGAARTNSYLEILKNKRIALVVNQTSLIGHTHLVDSLLALGIDVEKIFASEHGFRGEADAGAKIDDSKDPRTGLPIISLYGKHKKPTAADLANIDLVIFDIQDVGARFYTYISTMHYVMEACAESGVAFMVLDRPNPNGSYVDGPIRKEGFESFVGMDPIPIVHGLTVGELAQMIKGQGWINKAETLNLTVIPMLNYTHSTHYSLPVKPSPNLPNDLSIELYPSLCLFEGTGISVGRGTLLPFQIIGYPDSAFGSYQFTPVSIPGMSTHPPHEDKLCYGINFQEQDSVPRFTLKYLIDYYQLSANKSEFFNSYFNTLAGTDQLQEEIKAGLSEEEIKASWKAELDEFKEMRKKYLLYPN